MCEVPGSPLTRARYAADASWFRVPPQAVVCVLVTMRGAGTSVAGNAVCPGIVWTRSGTPTRCCRPTREARTVSSSRAQCGGSYPNQSAVQANEDALVLADGTSCKVQLDDLAGVKAHLAELLVALRVGLG